MDCQHTATCCRAAVLYNFYSPAVPAEWNRILGMYPDWGSSNITEHIATPRTAVVPTKPPQQWFSYHFKQYDNMMVGRPTLTLTTVWNCFTVVPLWAKEVLSVNMGAVQQYVAAYIAYIAAVDTGVREFILKWQLHLIPCAKLLCLKPALEAARAVMAVDESDCNGEIFLCLRKLDLLAGRSIKDADYAAEEKKMQQGLVLRFWPEKGRSTMDRYAQELVAQLDAVVAKTFGRSTPHQAYDEPLALWWKSRSRWTATGSSSQRDKVTLPDTGSKMARPNKKSVAEALQTNDLLAAMATTRGEFRGSTKPEPGFKQRALYAQDDLTYLRDAFVSRDIEKRMVGSGLMARQGAADVVEWVREAEQTGTHEHWVSLDYTDFNKEHNSWELGLVDCAVGASAPNSNIKTRNQRALLAAISAKARQRCFVRRHGHSVRTFSGLFSGHRNTARDNTLLHAAYSATVIKWAEEKFQTTFGHNWVGICGDDEDAKRSGLAKTAVYLAAHQLFGWTLNPRKQLVSFRWHEFLQRFAGAGADPSKPLARNLSALSTGNWYTMPGKYWDMAIQAVTDFGAEMVARGANWNYTRRLLAGYLDTYFNDGKSKRVWHKEAAKLNRLFWEDAELDAWESSTQQPEQVKIEANYIDQLPSNAVQDMIERDWQILVHLPKPDLQRIKKAWLTDSHASIVNPTTGKTNQQAYFNSLPLRRSHTLVRATGRPTPRLTAWPRLTATGSTRTELNQKDLLNRVGLDRRVLEALGGWEQLHWHGLGHLMQYWEPTRPSTIKPDKFCDWAILAHYGKHF